MGILTNEPNKSIIREARGSLEAVIKLPAGGSAARAGRETWGEIAACPAPLPRARGMGCSTHTELCQLFFSYINKISLR